jgi:hypothetical protein
MYTNQFGMAIKADYATVTMMKTDLVEAVERILSRTTPAQFPLTIDVTSDEDGRNVYIEVTGDNDGLKMLEDAGYMVHSLAEFTAQIMELIFGVYNEPLLYQWEDDEKISIHIPFEAYLKKVHQIA